MYTHYTHRIYSGNAQLEEAAHLHLRVHRWHACVRAFRHAHAPVTAKLVFWQRVAGGGMECRRIFTRWRWQTETLNINNINNVPYISERNVRARVRGRARET